MKKFEGNLDGEVWKDVRGYEGIYMVSNKGRVMRMELTQKAVANGKEIKMYYGKKILELIYNRDVYLYFLYDRTKNINKRVQPHTLVYNHFVKKTNAYIGHKDGDPTNNCVENLDLLVNINLDADIQVKRQEERGKHMITLIDGKYYVTGIKKGYDTEEKAKRMLALMF